MYAHHDEVFMLTSDVLDAVLTIADAVCARDRVQFVLCGDPLQLGEITPPRAKEISGGRLEVELLTRVVRPYVLVENFRQDGESEFASILNRARVGKASGGRALVARELAPVDARGADVLQESHIERVRRRWRQELNRARSASFACAPWWTTSTSTRCAPCQGSRKSTP